MRINANEFRVYADTNSMMNVVDVYMYMTHSDGSMDLLTGAQDGDVVFTRVEEGVYPPHPTMRIPLDLWAAMRDQFFPEAEESYPEVEALKEALEIERRRVDTVLGKVLHG